MTRMCGWFRQHDWVYVYPQAPRRRCMICGRIEEQRSHKGKWMLVKIGGTTHD